MHIFENTDGYSRVSLAQFPTPLQRLDRLSEHLRHEIWMKRDDLTGFAGGGNKVRKLEFLMAEALKQKATAVITVGALQSNHARQTAAAAARLGLACTLVLAEAVAGRTDAYANGGNLTLDRLVGAVIKRVPAGEDVNTAVNQAITDLEAQGHKVYVVPLGGSNIIGALGYAVAGREIEDQARAVGLMNPTIITGSGSAGTQAGLILGTDMPVLGISVAANESDLKLKISQIVNEGSELAQFPNADKKEINVDDRFVGAGYGQPSEEMKEAVELVARLEGIFLDPVYSGKAMAGLIHRVQSGECSGPIIFLHTGGMPALFAYDDVF
ncbi:D-cysteine desulfhydrase family protein [Klebsiella pneumoniae]|uniref:D-cysteine desulfhydrase family protein n=1 Tax=Rahnella perminowiae TaxID=2816244 RepID=UPI00300EEF20